jgi:hypothetical protein
MVSPTSSADGGRPTVPPAVGMAAATPLGEPAPRDGFLGGMTGRVPDAIPLLLIGIGAFALAVFAHDYRGGVTAGRVPLWSVFTVMGGVVVGGGVTVLVAGGDEGFGVADPACDPTARRLATAWEFGPEFSRPVSDEGSHPPPQGPSGTVPPSVSVLPPDPVRVEPWVSPSAPAGAGSAPVPSFEARPRLRDRSQTARSLQDVEAALDEIRAVSERASTVPAPVGARSKTNWSGSRGPNPVVSPPATAGPVALRPVPPMSTLPATSPISTSGRVVPSEPCQGCGGDLSGPNGGDPCTICSEPLCGNCNRRARVEGHTGVCPNCDRLLFKPGRE